MMERRLFEDVEGSEPSEPLRGTPRLRVACRDQIVMRMLALDQMLPADDEVRTVVAFVEQEALRHRIDGPAIKSHESQPLARPMTSQNRKPKFSSPNPVLNFNIVVRELIHKLGATPRR